MTAQAAVKSQEIALADLWEDPYPIYAQLRREDPVAWLPAANRYLITRHQDILALEHQPEVFSADEEGSLMKRVMGHSLLRKDGERHRRERTACEPALRPATIKDRWLPEFRRIVESQIDSFIAEGSADLFDRFAAPCAARALALLLGLPQASEEDLREWSQAMIDGTGNYGDDPKIWQRAEAAAVGVNAALDEAIPRLQNAPDMSLISCMLHADDPLSHSEINANVKVIIGGGLNEPRDAIATAVYGLLCNSQQRKDAEANPALWRAVFEETVRWVAPIGMYPRQTTCEVMLGGKVLPKGARVGVVLASANRDEALFDDPDSFNIHRAKKPHLAFGGGPHFCLGAWVARALVGEVAVPELFRRLKNLRLAPKAQVRFGGWVFRGPLNLPCHWDA